MLYYGTNFVEMKQKIINRDYVVNQQMYGEVTPVIQTVSLSVLRIDEFMISPRKGEVPTRGASRQRIFDAPSTDRLCHTILLNGNVKENFFFLFLLVSFYNYLVNSIFKTPLPEGVTEQIFALINNDIKLKIVVLFLFFRNVS